MKLAGERRRVESKSAIIRVERGVELFDGGILFGRTK